MLAVDIMQRSTKAQPAGLILQLKVVFAAELLGIGQVDLIP